jgi:hypothetical protein
MAQDQDAVGHLRHHREVVGDVDGGGVELFLIAASTSICVVTSSAVVGSSNTIRSGRHDMDMAVMARCSCPPETWCG